jgi:hypothetical protein
MPIIDRFEEDWAVIEHSNQTLNLPQSLLPESAKAGDVLQIIVTIDRESTLKQKRSAESLLDGFFDE